jgi:CelD/BcsL family acetyltransferase involved in cellulose biosynthesis
LFDTPHRLFSSAPKQLSIHVARSAGDLLSLRDDWDDLLSRCPDHHFSQTFDWALAGWKYVGEPRGRDLHVLTLRDGARLVGVWPLVTYLDRTTRIVRPLGAEASEYTIPLLDPTVDQRAWVQRLCKTAGVLGDLMLLPYVPDDTALATSLRQSGLWRTTDFPAPAFRIRRRDYQDWTHYLKTLGAKDRRELKRCRRRLAEAGTVELGPATVAEQPALVNWILERKQLWLEEHGMASEWIGRTDYGDFLTALAGSPPTDAHGVRLFRLKVGGTVIAANLVTVDGTQVEALINVYDKDWRGFAPGQLLMQHCIAWAFDQGLDFDLRIGDAAYKRNWASRAYATNTWYVATSLRGLGVVLERRWTVGYSRLRTKLANLKKAARRLGRDEPRAHPA